MLTFSRLYIRTERSIPRLEDLAESSFEAGDKTSKKCFGNRGGVVVQVREGSKDSKEIIVIITTHLSALYKKIGDYTPFKEGLEALLKKARNAGRVVRDRIVQKGVLEKGDIVASRVTRGHLMQLDRLERGVREGDISVEDANDMAKQLFKRAGEKLADQCTTVVIKLLKGIPARSTPRPRRPQPAAAAHPRIKRTFIKGISIERLPGSDEIKRRTLYT